jgi:hypothetical protein
MATLPEGVVAAYAHLSKERADEPEERARLDRLIHRPCMANVYCALAPKIFPHPDAWRVFLTDILLASYDAENWRETVKPARHQFERDKAAAIRSSQKLVAALRGLTDGGHGYYRQPAELEHPAALLRLGAIRNGYPEEAAQELADPLAEDESRRRDARLERLEALIDEAKAAGLDYVDDASLAECPLPVSVVDLLAGLVHALKAWIPEPDGQTQGTAPGPVFVRALDYSLAKHGMNAKALLTEEQMAALTRAALGLREEPDEDGKRFDAGNVYQARLYARK